MKRNIFFILSCLFLFFEQTHAQGALKSEFTDNDSILLHAAAEDPYAASMPRVLLPSPEVQAMARYGDYPVSLNTGLVDISVPIHEVRSGKISFPVKLQFHASGRRVSDTNGLYGFGWTLDAGGIVSRKLKGEPDEAHHPWLPVKAETERNYAYYSDFMPPYITAGGFKKKENEFDIFSYSLPSGKSGKFVIKTENGQNGQKKTVRAVTIPYDPVKIEFPPEVGNLNHTLKYLKITDTDGTQYYFGNIFNKTNCIQIQSRGQEYAIDNVPSAWFLNTVISGNSKDTVSFTYDTPAAGSNGQFVALETTSQYQIIKDNIIPGTEVHHKMYISNTGESGCSSILMDLYGYFVTLECVLQQNIMQNSSSDVIFRYGGNVSNPRIKQIKYRQGSLNFEYNAGNIYFMQRIVAKDHLNNKLKTVDFQFSDLSNYGNTITLDYLHIKNKNESATQTYSFEYYGNRNTAVGSRGRDWWGFSNGSGNTTLLPLFQVSGRPAGSSAIMNRNFGSSAVSRNPNETAMKNGMIKSITYPAGGKTVFDYEMNKYKVSGTKAGSGGGLRIKTIVNDDGKGAGYTKTFKYGEWEDGCGEISCTLDPDDPNNRMTENLNSLFLTYYGGTPDISLDYRQRIYRSDFFDGYFDFRSSIVTYPHVTEYISDGSSNTGKVHHLYSSVIRLDHTDEYGDEWPSPETVYHRLRSSPMGNEVECRSFFSNPEYVWKGGKLLKQTYYKKDLSTVIKSVNYDYENYVKERLETLVAERFVNINVLNFSGSSYYGEKYYEENYSYFGKTVSVFADAIYKLISGAELLSRETTVQDGVETIREFTYDPTYALPVREKVTVKQGTYETNYAYPFSDSYKNTSPYNEMIGLNMLSPVVERSLYKNGSFLQQIRNGYLKWSNNFIAPRSVSTRNSKQTTAENRIVYHRYDDFGNPLYITGDDTEKVVCLWGYARQYPIAEIRDVSYEDVCKKIGNGNQATGEAALNTMAAKSEPSAADLQTIDNLRISLPEASVTTYTYLPAVGIKTVTNPQGVKATFEYDAFNRLQYIKDNAGKIIEDHDYHHKNQ